MRINVNGGHSSLSQGASKYLNEVTEDRKIKDALITELRLRGHIVTDSTTDNISPSSILRGQAASANKSGADLAISIHLNAGGATGTEVWYWEGSDEGFKVATKVSSAVSKMLGIKNRGAKHTRDLYWLKHTTMPAILVEVCFVDSGIDRDAYKKVGYAAVAYAIAEAIGRGRTYTVKSGDTLYSIARTNHTTVDGLKKANRLKTDLIKVGQTLIISD